jgi:hypothetical protein
LKIDFDRKNILNSKNTFWSGFVTNDPALPSGKTPTAPFHFGVGELLRAGRENGNKPQAKTMGQRRPRKAQAHATTLNKSKLRFIKTLIETHFPEGLGAARMQSISDLSGPCPTWLGEAGRNTRMHSMLKGMTGMHLYIYIANGL